MGNQFVAMEQFNITQPCAVYKKYTLPASAILTVRWLVLRIPGVEAFILWLPGYKWFCFMRLFVVVYKLVIFVLTCRRLYCTAVYQVWYL